MTDAKSLREAIEQYETQLLQVKTTLANTEKGPDRDNLVSLESDIEELINLTKESLDSLENGTSSNHDNDDDPFADEYALFKAEIGEDENAESDSEEKNEESQSQVPSDVKAELMSLEGSKCRAPHGSSWGGTGYHNAMICSVSELNEDIESLNDIMVKVLFTNPTHREMMPCPFFLDGSCKFTDEQCHYSHGEVISFSSLQEYREPDFTNIKVGSRVLTKHSKNQLWHKSVILKLPTTTEEPYRVKFEANGNITEVLVQDILPLDDSQLDMSDTSSSESDDGEPSTLEDNQKNEELVHKSLLTVKSSDPLGGWEQHTRGMGSKIMAQMGYITGTGLGKRADGRMDPVEATVLPARKSLDHCMALREQAGGNEDLFTVERKMRKQQRKMEIQRQKQYEKEKQRKDHNVFNFINTTLSDKRDSKDEVEASTSKTSRASLKAESNKSLSVASFQIGENIAKLEKEAAKLKVSLGKHAKGSIPYNSIVIQYNEKQKELESLRKSEKNIATEQSHRKTKAKLTVF